MLLPSNKAYDEQQNYSSIIIYLLLFINVFLHSNMLLSYLVIPFETGKFIVGICCVLAACGYYIAPASTMREVIETKNASSIDLYMVIVNAINGFMWGVYGLAIGDWFIFAPNTIGTLFAALLITLKLWYPSENNKSGEKENPAVSANLQQTLV